MSAEAKVSERLITEFRKWEEQNLFLKREGLTIKAAEKKLKMRSWMHVDPRYIVWKPDVLKQNSIS